MTSNRIFPCGRISRRSFLHQAGGGFFGVAMGGVWAEAGAIPDARLRASVAPKANSVIFLFMCGGVSHIDTFDPKDNKWAGKLIDAVGFGDNRAEMRRPVIPCLRTFTRHGKSGGSAPSRGATILTALPRPSRSHVASLSRFLTGSNSR